MPSETIRKNAIDLRRNQTEAEKVIWNLIRNQKLGFKFKRQQPIDRYIVDFICFEKRIIIEIDGGQHNEQTDKNRTTYLEAQGFKILRFWNSDIMKNKAGVLLSIQSVLSDPSPALRRPLPQGER